MPVPKDMGGGFFCAPPVVVETCASTQKQCAVGMRCEDTKTGPTCVYAPPPPPPAAGKCTVAHSEPGSVLLTCPNGKEQVSCAAGALGDASLAQCCNQGCRLLPAGKCSFVKAGERGGGATLLCPNGKTIQCAAGTEDAPSLAQCCDQQCMKVVPPPPPPPDCALEGKVPCMFTEKSYACCPAAKLDCGTSPPVCGRIPKYCQDNEKGGAECLTGSYECVPLDSSAYTCKFVKAPADRAAGRYRTAPGVQGTVPAVAGAAARALAVSLHRGRRRAQAPRRRRGRRRAQAPRRRRGRPPGRHRGRRLPPGPHRPRVPHPRPSAATL